MNSGLSLFSVWFLDCLVAYTFPLHVFYHYFKTLSSVCISGYNKLVAIEYVSNYPVANVLSFFSSIQGLFRFGVYFSHF